MRTLTHKLTVFMLAFLLAMPLAGCRDDEIPSANPSLVYPEGELAPGAGPYVSAQPSVKAEGTVVFAIAGVKHGGVSVDSAMAGIDPATGVVTLTVPDTAEAVGEYLISVSVSVDGRTTTYPDALRVVVRGILFEESDVVLQRGEERVIPVGEVCLVQTGETLFSLEVPEEGTNSYAGISVDAGSCAVTVAADADAGVYPISIRVTNRTNPDGTLFSDVLTLTVESEPYGLSMNRLRLR